MDSRLYSAGYLAIPLKANEGSFLNPQPNWLVIENIFGKLTANLPVLGETLCKQSVYKIVYREILPESTALGRPEQLNDIIWENTNQPIPVTIAPAFDTYENLQASVNDVNQMLALFQFRGVLSGFTLKVDEDVLNEILNPVVSGSSSSEPPVSSTSSSEI